MFCLLGGYRIRSLSLVKDLFSCWQYLMASDPPYPRARGSPRPWSCPFVDGGCPVSTPINLRV